MILWWNGGLILLKKAGIIVLISIFVILLIICMIPRATEATFEFRGDTENISSIEIVKVGTILEDNVNSHTLKEITDINSFLEDFSKIECKKLYYGIATPTGIEGTLEQAIKVTYSNGDYEIIDHLNQLRYTSELGVKDRTLYILDKGQYNALIKKYLKDGN